MLVVVGIIVGDGSGVGSGKGVAVGCGVDVGKGVDVDVCVGVGDCPSDEEQAASNRRGRVMDKAMMNLCIGTS